MTISRSKRTGGAALRALAPLLTALALACLPAATVLAQDDEPESAGDGAAPDEQPKATGKPRSLILGPYVEPGSVSGVEDEADDDGAAGADTFSEDGEGDPAWYTEDAFARQGAVVETDELAALDPAAVGTLVPGQGGLEADMWRDTSQATLLALLPKIPVATSSPVVNRLGRKLLLTAASLPEPRSPDDDRSADILALRLQRISAAGQAAALIDIMDRLPVDRETAAMRRMKADAHLLRGNIEGACETGRRARSLDGTPQSMRIVALCQALAGERGAMDMTLGLLEETGHVSGFYYHLMDRIYMRARGESPPGDAPTPTADAEAGTGLERLDALDAVLFPAAQVDVPRDLLETAPVPVAAALAARGGVDPVIRAEAARRGAAAGLVSARRLGEAFDALIEAAGGADLEGRYALAAEAPSEDEAADEAAADEGGEGGDESVIDEAGLYRLARSAPTARQQLEYAEAAWQRARDGGYGAAMAAVLVRAIWDVAPGSGLTDHTLGVGRLALLAGESEMAARWYNQARAEAGTGSATAARALVDMWPLMLVTDRSGNTPVTESILDLWLRGLVVLPEDEQNRRASLLFGLIEAFGHEIPEALWTKMLTGPSHEEMSGPSLALWRQMAIATAERRTGEIVLLSLVAMGDEGPAGLSPASAATIVRGLLAVGLKAEARAVALEALVGAGF